MFRLVLATLLIIAVCVAAQCAVPKAIMNLGDPDTATMMTHIQGGDGDTTTASIGGLSCRRNTNPAEDFYFYFGIDNSFAYQGSRPDMYISIHYYDTGTSTLSLQYDAASEVFKSGGSVTLTNTNTWKIKIFHVTDGYFGNRQNGGADFRIAGPVGVTVYLDMVYARDFGGPGPNKPVRMVPPPGRPAMDGAPFRALMDNTSQWPVARGQVDTMCYYGWAFGNYSDAELGGWLAQMVSWGMKLSFETGAVKPGAPTGEDCFNNDHGTWDRVLNLGGTVDGFAMDEPLTACRGWDLGDDNYAVNETVDWIQLVRQNYSGAQIGSIEAFPYISLSTLQWWITALQNTCAARSVEGIDYFILDADWRNFPGNGSWSNVKTLENFCRTNGLPFSLIYWNSPHSTSMNDCDYYNDIMNEGNAYKNAGGTPDEYCVQSWETIPQVQVPENGTCTFTRATVDFVNQFVPRTQSPYSGVVSLPGTVQCENYDNGGETVSCHDSSIGNSGGANRITESVDVENTSDAGGGQNVGFIDTGEWIEYTVNVTATNTYDINIRVASPSGGSFHIEFNGQNVTGSKSVPNTGDWQAWTTVTASGCSLTAGQQVMRIVIESGGWNLNYVQVAASSQSPYAGVIGLPGVAQAENFDNGGEGVAYHDNDGGNNGGQYRSTDVDIEGCSEGGYNVGWMDTGEWLEYTVNVASSGTYNVNVRTASPNSGCTFHIEMNGVDKTGTQTVDNTGGWQTWSTKTITGVSLSAGQQIMRFCIDNGGFNLNYIEVAGQVTLNNSTFDADANGWSLTTWRASTAYGYGTMAWNSGAGRTGGGLRCSGTGSSDNTDRCTREGGEAKKTISTAGYSNIRVYYDLRVNTLGSNRTGTGSGSCAVDHNLIDEQITVFYSTNGGSSWSEAEYLLRGTLLSTYQTYGTRTIDLTGVSAVNNNPNFRLRFRWQVNSAADSCDLDNIRVTSN